MCRLMQLLVDPNLADSGMNLNTGGKVAYVQGFVIAGH